jgi:hypothetical protein
VAGYYVCGNEPSGFIKCGEFPDDLHGVSKSGKNVHK